MADVTYNELLDAQRTAISVHGAQAVAAYLRATYKAATIEGVNRSDWNNLYLHFKKWPDTAMEITFAQLAKMRRKIIDAGQQEQLIRILTYKFITSDITEIPSNKWEDLHNTLFKMEYEIDNPSPVETVIKSTSETIQVSKYRYNMRLQGWELLRTIDATSDWWAEVAVKSTTVQEVYRYTTECDGKSLMIDSIHGSLFD